MHFDIVCKILAALYASSVTNMCRYVVLGRAVKGRWFGRMVAQYAGHHVSHNDSPAHKYARLREQVIFGLDSIFSASSQMRFLHANCTGTQRAQMMATLGRACRTKYLDSHDQSTRP